MNTSLSLSLSLSLQCSPVWPAVLLAQLLSSWWHLPAAIAWGTRMTEPRQPSLSDSWSPAACSAVQVENNTYNMYSLIFNTCSISKPTSINVFVSISKWHISCYTRTFFLNITHLIDIERLHMTSSPIETNAKFHVNFTSTWQTKLMYKSAPYSSHSYSSSRFSVQMDTSPLGSMIH